MSKLCVQYCALSAAHPKENLNRAQTTKAAKRSKRLKSDWDSIKWSPKIEVDRGKYAFFRGRSLSHKSPDHYGRERMQINHKNNNNERDLIIFQT